MRDHARAPRRSDRSCDRGGRPKPADRTRRITPGEAARVAQARFPDKRVTTLYFVPNEPIHVYLRGAGDSNAIEGSSVVWVHPTCQGLVHAIDRSEIGGALAAQNMMFSLHGGYWFGPVLGPILVVITGLSLVFFSVSGVIVFFLRTWRPKKVPTPITGPVPAE